MGTGARATLEFANARKFVVCNVERDIVQQTDIERAVDHFDSAITPSEKSSIITNRKSTAHFPMSPR